MPVSSETDELADIDSLTLTLASLRSVGSTAPESLVPTCSLIDGVAAAVGGGSASVSGGASPAGGSSAGARLAVESSGRHSIDDGCAFTDEEDGVSECVAVERRERASLVRATSAATASSELHRFIMPTRP